MSNFVDTPAGDRTGSAPPASADRQQGSSSTRPRPASARLAAILGLLVGLLVAGLGLAYTAAHAPSWSAHRNVVLGPAPGGNRLAAASLYDSLSRGQVAATAQVIYGQRRWHPDTPDVTVTAGVITPSAVVQVTATGPDRTDVVHTVTEVTARATAQVNETLAPYRAVVLETDTPTAEPSGLSRSTLAVVAVLAGLLAGAVAAGAGQRVARRRERDLP